MAEDRIQEEQVAAEETVEQVQQEQAPVDGAEEVTAEEDALITLQQQLAEKDDEVVAAKEQILRAAAELQNIKRRAQQDVEKAHKFALKSFVESLLPIVDSLEKGIESAEQAEGSHESMKEGMDLTLKLMLDTLTKHGVKQLNPVGEPLDPNFHQAISMVPNPEMEPNSIMDVFQKGYTLNDRVVRPAMVVVAKAP